MRRKAKDKFGEVLNDVIENKLFKYQRRWLLDQSQLKLAVKSRQIGFSTLFGLEGALDVLRGENVYYFSKTEQQSIALLEKFYKWLDFFLQAIPSIDFDSRSATGCRINGAEARSFTSEPKSAEGNTGNIYLDEFSLHDNDRAVYQSLYPTISWGYKLRIISRPRGQSNLFYELATDTGKYPDFSRYSIDVYSAVKDGLPFDVDSLKRNFTDEGWAENYECKFLDESTAYLPYALLRAAIAEEVSKGGDNYLGIDIGRKRDLSVLYVLRKLGEAYYTVSVQTFKGLPFGVFRQKIAQCIDDYNIIGGSIDATGLGMQLAEEVHSDFPFINTITFTADWKARLATLIKSKFEQNTLYIPSDDDLISDFHTIKRKVTDANRIVYDADRTGDGHADRFWALALALDSAEVTKIPKITILDFETDDELISENY